jgi:ABC-type transport system involved in cytochrome c biogenesis permease subunit
MIVSLGLILHSAALGVRIINAGHLPLTGLYEFTTLFSWGLALIFIIIGRRMDFFCINGIIYCISALLLILAFTLPAQIHSLPPALRSAWLQIHVLFAIMAYGAFAAAFATAVFYLIKARTDGFRSSFAIDKMIYRTIAFGFCFQTLVIITGAVWAEQVWGSWWSWDPKETWALITWLIYAYYLHSRLQGSLNGRRGAWFSIIGFLAVVFTLFGVSLWIPGLHSYK